MKQRQADFPERIMELEIERLRDFKGHPYQVREDQEMERLFESVAEYGILTPLIVRPLLDGCYEIISGHRRRFVAERLGYTKVPVLIRSMDDDESVIAMVDSNLQRSDIRPSEKAFAYKLKYDALQRVWKQKTREERNSAMYPERGKTGSRSLADYLGELGGESGKQVRRYIRLTQLDPGLLAILDEGRMGFNPAVEIAYMSPEDQNTVREAMEYTQCTPSLSQAKRLKDTGKQGRLTMECAVAVLSESELYMRDRISFQNEKLSRYFPAYYTTQMMKEKIIELLKNWNEEQKNGPKKGGYEKCVK